MSMAYKDLVPLNVIGDMVEYASNDLRFAKKVLVPVMQAKGFEQLCVDNKMTIELWSSYIPQKGAKR